MRFMNLALSALLLFSYAATFTDQLATSNVYDITFQDFKNLPESELIDSTNPNWIHANQRTAFECQGKQVPKTSYFLIPPNGPFMITYIYSRPSLKNREAAVLKTEWLQSSTGRAELAFFFAKEKNSKFRIYRQDSENTPPVEIFEYGHGKVELKYQSIPLAFLPNRFRLIFAAKVEDDFPYGPRTYLSQVSVAGVHLKLR